MDPTDENAQSSLSVEKNISFFQNNVQSYGSNIGELDTYKNIRSKVNQELAGIQRLLDVGNGGVFDYDTSAIREIVAIDLFLDTLSANIPCPPNVTFKNGSALKIPEPNESFDGVIMVMLLHHLIGKTVSESLRNVFQAFHEALRVLKPHGKLVIVESCVPGWFYRLECLVFPIACFLIGKTLSHPPTIQYPIAKLVDWWRSANVPVEFEKIPKGRWVLQYGFKVPSCLTPIQVYRLVIRKQPLVKKDVKE